ncbi:MAG: hypothetical protein IT210_19775 [Armatimonadetes bacterium]|nr:hypothetical protein [Armatimonadota bacterium]
MSSSCSASTAERQALRAWLTQDGHSPWMPLAAELTATHVADNEVAPALLREVPLDPCAVPGD